MAWKVQWRVSCEKCTNVGPIAPESTQAEEKALKIGWQRGQFYGIALHLCPSCFDDGVPDWWPDATGTKFHFEEDE